jgi:signal transduction histidine kinase
MSSASVLLGTTIHDLRTHLTAIIAASDIISEEIKPELDENMSRLVRAINRNAHTMDGKLSKLLRSYSNFDGIQYDEPPINAVAVVSEIISELSPVVSSRKQTITVDMQENLPSAHISKQYLEYLIRTLLHNASKFTPAGGSIRLSVQNKDETLLIQVSDNGIGIPEQEIDRIFEPHNKIFNNGRGDNSGSGIGLAMAKYLAELNGGKMWVNSTVGQGSVFSLSLPAGY